MGNHTSLGKSKQEDQEFKITLSLQKLPDLQSSCFSYVKLFIMPYHGFYL